jgi:hypothetical protein
MVRRTLLIGMMIFCLGAADAQTPGQNSALLQNTLTAISNGSCPDSLLSPMAKYTCEQQLQAIQARLNQLGAIGSVVYSGLQYTPQGPIESYTVKFANGQMLWLVTAGPDGKVAYFWSPG